VNTYLFNLQETLVVKAKDLKEAWSKVNLASCLPTDDDGEVGVEDQDIIFIEEIKPPFETRLAEAYAEKMKESRR